MRRAITITLVIVVIVIGGWFIYQQFSKAKAAETANFEVVLVKRGNISATVNATGAVLPEREASLAFQTAGTIVEVTVEVGDQVVAGQLLARLDTIDLELAVRQAEIGLRTAEIQMRQLQAGPGASDLAAAQAALESAKAAYQQLLQGPDADQLAAARAAVEQARVALNQAQQAYDLVKDLPNVGMMPQALQLQQATINYETAEAQYRVTARGPNQAQIAAAQAQVAQAQAALDRLKQGPTPEQLELAEAAVEQAKLTLEQARHRLENARLLAPWDGVVTAVNIVEGALAQPGVPAIQLADLSRFHINVQVDEIDIANITPGQPVQVEVDALPETRLQGTVTKIAPAGQVAQAGGVSYRVTIDIEPSSAPLRAGMSATATIISTTRQNVLLVPNRAVQLDRTNGRTFVERLTADGPQKTEIRLGLRDDQHSEVRAGLEEGDRLVIRSVSSREQLQQTFSAF